jgi:hypothetical protein
MDKAYDDFLAAYQAWECASESCHARLLQSADADSTVSGVAADFDQLQRLYVDWLDKLGPLLSDPEPVPPRTLRH